jgi:triose/dihydroxyacetone kinase / FAD-AMP lyase (cyclizing)
VPWALQHCTHTSPRHAAARSLQETGGSGVKDFVAALKAGAQAVKEHGGAEEGFRTMLDALMPAVRAAEGALAAGAGGPCVVSLAP